MELKEILGIVLILVVFFISIFAYFDIIPEFDGFRKVILIVLFGLMAITSVFALGVLL
jgi:hypothetical protein